MKGLILTAVAFLAISCGAFAQTQQLWDNFPPQLRWDVGFNIGASGITRPIGPENAYTGTRTNVVPDYSLKLVYAFNPNWNIHFDVGWRKWESYGNWSNPYLMGTSLKNTPITFQLGSPAVTESISVNYVIPFYSDYKIFNKANIYFGATLGLVNTISDGSIGYSKYNNAPDSSYRYISKYNYGAGIGYSVGVQVGYTYYIWRKLGVNVELAARYVNMQTGRTNTIADDHGTDHYKLLFLPETVGIRYRFK